MQALLLLGEEGAKVKDVVTKALAAGLMRVQPGEEESKLESKFRACLQGECYGIWHRIERATWAHTAFPTVK